MAYRRMPAHLVDALDAGDYKRARAISRRGGQAAAKKRKKQREAEKARLQAERIMDEHIAECRMADLIAHEAEITPDLPLSE